MHATLSDYQSDNPIVQRILAGTAPQPIRQAAARGALPFDTEELFRVLYVLSTDPEEDGEYNNGTGRELFSYIPRGVLPNVLVQAEGDTHDWDVDSPVRVADVFIDPVHTGIPTADDNYLMM